MTHEKFSKYYFNFLLLFLAEHDFSIYPASNIAASAIAASLSGLNWHVRSRISIYDLVDKLAELSESESVSNFLPPSTIAVTQTSLFWLTLNSAPRASLEVH